MKQKDKLELSLRDLLALDRTRMANQRTLLAFTVTSMHVAALGVTFHKVKEFTHLKWLFLPLLIGSGIVFVIGIISYLRVRHSVNHAYQSPASLGE